MTPYIHSGSIFLAPDAPFEGGLALDTQQQNDGTWHILSSSPILRIFAISSCKSHDWLQILSSPPPPCDTTGSTVYFHSNAVRGFIQFMLSLNYCECIFLALT